MKISLIASLTAAGLSLAFAASAQGPGSGTGVPKDEPQAAGTVPVEKQEPLDPIRNSTLFLDQSMTTQTAHLETTPQQSYVPLYEWWISFRPRYYFTDGHGQDDVYVAGRFDFTKEFTNNQPTTDYREDVFGDIWLWFAYSHAFEKTKLTKLTIGPRLLLPTSKVSQADGIYLTAGVFGGVTHKFPINGEDAPWFTDTHLGISFDYRHPFSQGTTPTEYGQFTYTREDTEGRSFVSDQLTGTTLVNHELFGIVDYGLQITQKLSFTADMIFINQWHYLPPDSASVPVAGGSVNVPRGSNDTQFTQDTWFIANVEYDLFPEVSLGLGYYNLQNTIAPDGTRRGILSGDNVWWSPDARVFFDVTANLDKIFEDASGRYRTREVSQAARAARIDQIEEEAGRRPW